MWAKLNFSLIFLGPTRSSQQLNSKDIGTERCQSVLYLLHRGERRPPATLSMCNHAICRFSGEDCKDYIIWTTADKTFSVAHNFSFLRMRVAAQTLAAESADDFSNAACWTNCKLQSMHDAPQMHISDHFQTSNNITHFEDLFYAIWQNILIFSLKNIIFISFLWYLVRGNLHHCKPFSLPLQSQSLQPFFISSSYKQCFLRLKYTVV